VQGCWRLQVYEMEFHSEEETQQYRIHLSLEAVCRQLQHLRHALVQDTMEPIFAPSGPTCIELLDECLLKIHGESI